MPAELKKLIRTLQTKFPMLAGTKSALQRAYYRFQGRPHDADFYLIKHIQIQPEEVLLDIGANRGQSIDSLRTLLPHVKIHSFEANADLAQILVNRYRNYPTITVHDFGLGSNESVSDLYIPYYNGWMFDGLASLIEAETRDFLKTRIYGYKEELLRIKKIDCRIKTLDSLRLRPAFIKIDVQGFEADVLQGAVSTIQQNHPVILLEDPTETIRELADRLDYDLLEFRDGRFFVGRIGGHSGVLVSRKNRRGIVIPNS